MRLYSGIQPAPQICSLITCSLENTLDLGESGASKEEAAASPSAGGIWSRAGEHFSILANMYWGCFSYIIAFNSDSYSVRWSIFGYMKRVAQGQTTCQCQWVLVITFSSILTLSMPLSGTSQLALKRFLWNLQERKLPPFSTTMCFSPLIYWDIIGK